MAVSDDRLPVELDARRHSDRPQAVGDEHRLHRPSGASAPPKLGPNAGHQLARAERLDDVVVGPQVEADDLVRVAAARGEQDDRHIAVLAQPAADLQPVEAGQHDVEQDEVEAVRSRAAARALGPSAASVDTMAARARGTGAAAADLGVVVDDQDRRRPAISPITCGRLTHRSQAPIAIRITPSTTCSGRSQRTTARASSLRPNLANQPEDAAAGARSPRRTRRRTRAGARRRRASARRRRCRSGTARSRGGRSARRGGRTGSEPANGPARPRAAGDGWGSRANGFRPREQDDPRGAMRSEVGDRHAAAQDRAQARARGAPAPRRWRPCRPRRPARPGPPPPPGDGRARAARLPPAAPTLRRGQVGEECRIERQDAGGDRRADARRQRAIGQLAHRLSRPRSRAISCSALRVPRPNSSGRTVPSRSMTISGVRRRIRGSDPEAVLEQPVEGRIGHREMPVEALPVGIGGEILGRLGQVDVERDRRERRVALVRSHDLVLLRAAVAAPHRHGLDEHRAASDASSASVKVCATAHVGQDDREQRVLGRLAGGSRGRR